MTNEELDQLERDLQAMPVEELTKALQEAKDRQISSRLGLVAAVLASGLSNKEAWDRVVEIVGEWING